MAPSKPKLSTTEFNSLYEFYNVTNGPFWRWHNISIYSTEWDFTTPNVNPCSDKWQGLQCSCGVTTCTIQILKLDHQNVTGTLPDCIGNWNEITTLILRGNNISGTIPPAIGNLTQLIHLDLSNNNLQGPIPSTIGQLLPLRRLDLNNNYLTFIPIELYQLINLLDLGIGYNRIRNHPISNRLGNLVNLKILYLRENPFNGPIPSSIGNLTKLLSLDISEGHLTGSIPKELYQCRNLTGLALRGNYLTGTIHPDIGNLKQLISFDVDFNMFFGPLPDTIGEMANLQAIILNDNMFSRSIPSTITQCKRLRDFIIEENTFTGDASIFSNMTIIENLYLGKNLFSQRFTIYSSDVYKTLIYFDIANNLLTGPLPWINNDTNWGHVLLDYIMNDNYFTNTLPDDYHSVNALLYFVIQNNYISGTVPNTFLNNDNITYMIDFASNLLSGPLPNFLGNQTSFSQLLLYENFFTGTISRTLSGLKRLVVFDVSYNQLTGTLPPLLLQELPLLEEFFVESNRLIGPLSNALNITRSIKLVNVDVSDNQFTGIIPSEIFLNAPNLQSFAASKNCLEGYIPTEICSVPGLASLSLDGVTTSNNCKSLIFGHIPYFNGFIATHYLKGTIPTCLYEIPTLLLLHISGNSFTGTIPSGLILSDSLNDLSLSHNSLTGSIPKEIQERSWNNLDLSYNKLSGTLISNFSSIPRFGQLNLQVNRLSGSIPSNLLKRLMNTSSQSINILNGNIFSCDLLQTDLPPNDPEADKYSCGSDSTNDVLYAWIIAIVLLPLLLLFFMRCMKKVFQFSQENVQRIFRKLKIWKNALKDDSYHHIHIQRLSIYFHEMRLVSTYLTLYIMIVLIPIYSILKLYSASYSVEYAWSISALLNSGKIAAIITFLVLFVLGLLYFYVLRRVLRFINKKVPHLVKEEQEEEKEYEKKDKKIPNDKIPKIHRFIVYFIVCLMNLIIMSFVDFSYVYIVLNYPTTIVTFAALGVALFRLITNYIISWTALPATYNWVVWIKDCCRSSSKKGNSSSERRLTLDPDYYSASDTSFLENLVLFNNIIIPGLAIIFILPDCFYNALFAADNVQSSYYYSSCYQYVAIISYGHVCSQFTETTEYSPPFIYSYQCSSKIVINYVPVYILMFILAGILIPIFKFFLKFLYDLLKGNNNARAKSLRKIIEVILPEYFKDFKCDFVPALTEVSESSLSHDSSIAPRTMFAGNGKRPRLFSKLTMTVQINSYLTILMCFGALFPPLALIAAMSIYSITYFEELWIGWVLTETRGLGLGYGWYEEQIERECEGVEESSNLTIWSTLVVSCCLYGYMIFDTMGDRVGWEGALPMTLMMMLMPVVCYGGIVLYREWVNRRSGSGGMVERKEQKGEVVEFGREESVEEGKDVIREGSSIVVRRTEASLLSVGGVRTISTIELAPRLTERMISKDLDIVDNPLVHSVEGQT